MFSHNTTTLRTGQIGLHETPQIFTWCLKSSFAQTSSSLGKVAQPSTALALQSSLDFFLQIETRSEFSLTLLQVIWASALASFLSALSPSTTPPASQLFLWRCSTSGEFRFAAMLSELDITVLR
jgi:hypothetical protein